MGYYTTFTLKIFRLRDEPEDDQLSMEFEKDLPALIGVNEEDYNFEEKIKDRGLDWEYGFSTLFECESTDEIKWYEYDKDMKILSKLFPFLVFQLDGSGEESGDIWRLFYKNGKSHGAGPILVYQEFNSQKLK